MTYKLKFLPIAQQEWNTLNSSIKEIFKKKLAKRLEDPEIPKDKLRGDLKDCYKIKLLKLGYRLIYKVNKHDVTVLVIAVGRRDKSIAYKCAEKRVKDN
jgi:mRNA interferase RelE/StbE